MQASQTSTDAQLFRSSTTVLAPSSMPEPTLGCQIAPNYDREQWLHTSDSDTIDTESEAESEAESRADAGTINDALPIENAETQHSRGLTPALSKINTQRSRRRSNATPLPPAGFWHWQMVRLAPGQRTSD